MNVKELKKELEDHKTARTITRTTIGTLKHAYNGTTSSVYSFGNVNYGRGITIRGILKDQAKIVWTNFLCGRWSMKWKEAQKKHYLRMNKKKSAHL